MFLAETSTLALSISNNQLGEYVHDEYDNENQINLHSTLGNEKSIVSFQVNGSHVCGGVLVSFVHVLIVINCLNLLYTSKGPVFAVPGIAHGPKNSPGISIRTIIDVEETVDLKLVIVSNSKTRKKSVL